jgi:hypothetical protein
MDALLRHPMLARLLTDEHALGIAPNTPQNGRINQPVVEHYIALLQQLLGPERQQIRIAWTGANQPHLPACGTGRACRGQLRSKLLLDLHNLTCSVQ